MIRLNIDEESFIKFIYDEKLCQHEFETTEEFRDRYLKYLEGLNNDN